jgi:hypothetical protein
MPVLRVVARCFPASAIHSSRLSWKRIQIVEQEKTMRCRQSLLRDAWIHRDGGVERLEKWVTEIRKHLNVLIALDLVPPATNDWIDKTYAMGVDALYYDSDFFNPDDDPQGFRKA